MKKLIILFTLYLFFSTYLLNSTSAQEKDIPKLQNPFSVLFIKEHLSQSKPRMIYNKEIVKDVRDKIRTNPVIANLYQAIRNEAFKILDMPVIERIGPFPRGILRRINMLGLVYLIERDEVIRERINNELLAICNFSDWNPPVYLNVAETSMAISLALDWTLDDLPESTIKKAKKALIEKGIYPSWPEYGGNPSHNWWITHSNNWNQVCNGGMIAASIAIADDEPELAAKTIKRALDGLRYALYENYYPEGVYPEGPMYWEYGTSYSVLTASMLETAFGSDFGIKDYPGFMESAISKVMTTNTPSGWYYNYADSKDEPNVDGDVILAWFATQTGESMFYEKDKFLIPAKDIRIGHLTGSAEEIRVGYFTGAALSWMCKFKELSTKEPPLAWVGKGRSPVAVFRGEGNNGDYYFGAKGGCGAVSHGNMDAGSFIFELNGVRWSVDPGSQSYMIGEQGFDLWRQCQECQRWELLTKNNHGHSTLTINDGRHIVDGYAIVEKYKTSKNPSVTFDLTPTFEGQLKSAFRTFTKDSERSLLIEDKIKPNENTKLVTWQFITQAEVEIVEEGAILKQDGKMLKLINLSHQDIHFTVVSLDPPPHKLDKQIDNLKRVELRLPAPYGTGKSGLVIIKVLLKG